MTEDILPQSMPWTHLVLMDTEGVPVASICAPFDMAVVSLQNSVSRAIFAEDIKVDDLSLVALHLYDVSMIEGKRACASVKSFELPAVDFLKKELKALYEGFVQEAEPVDAV